MTTFINISDWIETSTVLPDWLLKLIKDVLGETNAETIVSLKPIELAQLLKSKIVIEGTGNDPWFENTQNEDSWKKCLLGASLDLINQLKKLGYEPLISKEVSQPSQPQSIKVELEQPLENKSLKEKLAHGILHPEDSWSVLELIEQDPIYRKASIKAIQSFGYPKCIAFISGMVAEDATIGYLNWLSREHSTPQQEWDGCDLGTLKEALKIEEKLRVHPFSEKTINGPDELGFNYLTLDDKDPELYDAIVWARRSQNPLFPRNIDLFEAGTEVLSHLDSPLELSSRWEQIRKAFKSSKRGGNAKEGIRCEVAVKKSTSFIPEKEYSTDKISSTNPDFKELVYRNIDSVKPSRSYQGSGQRITGIVRRFSTQGSGCYFDLIVLEGGSIQGSGCSGTIKIPEWGAQPSMQGSGISVNIKKISWKEVAQAMDLLN